MEDWQLLMRQIFPYPMSRILFKRKTWARAVWYQSCCRSCQNEIEDKAHCLEGGSFQSFFQFYELSEV